LQSTYQNTRQTMGFQKNIVSNIPPGNDLIVLMGSAKHSDMKVLYYFITLRHVLYLQDVFYR